MVLPNLTSFMFVRRRQHICIWIALSYSALCKTSLGVADEIRDESWIGTLFLSLTHTHKHTHTNTHTYTQTRVVRETFASGPEERRAERRAKLEAVNIMKVFSRFFCLSLIKTTVRPPPLRPTGH